MGQTTPEARAGRLDRGRSLHDWLPYIFLGVPASRSVAALLIDLANAGSAGDNYDRQHARNRTFEAFGVFPA